MTAAVIDLVVTNYRTPELVYEFIEAYRQADIRIPHTLTVVDVDPVRPLPLKYACQLVVTTTNVGYSGACNLASTMTSSPNIAFFNSDVKIFPQSVEKSVEILQSDEAIGVVGPLQVNDRGLVTHAGIYGTLAKPKHRAWMQAVTPNLRFNEEAVMVSGSAFFTKRDLWTELYQCPIYRKLHPNVVGAFLPTPHYYEETWYCYHAHAHGRKIMYCGEAMMYHGWHKSSPVGSVERKLPESQRMFREACDHHSIPHD